MEQINHPITVYEGRDPFIFASYHPFDAERVLPVLETIDHRGFRFWISEGMTPGMDADEIIAEHIERCDLFIGFLSRNYLASLDTVDELNFSRDVDKQYLLVYLDDVSLPAGLDMRFLRARSIRGFAMDEAAISAQLMTMEGANRFYGIANEALRPAAERLFRKLEALYPEHQVFALDAVAKHLSADLSKLYVKAGYTSVVRLLQDYGFELISTDQARKLRSSVLYQPGQEPEVIKTRMDSIMATLSADYPNKVISDNLSKSHSSIYKSLQGLSVWLGYDSAADLLSAYGFTGVRAEVGRSSIDHDALLETIRQRYAGKVKPDRVAKLLAEQPDLRPGLKTLSNRSNELFGMTLNKYFRQTGILEQPEKQELPTKTAQQRAGILEKLRSRSADGPQDYGTFEDTLESLDGVVLKENTRHQIYISDCTFAAGTLRLPLGIDFIGAEAFAGQSDITQLILPPGLREIGEGAFMDCSGLESIVFSEGLEFIGSNAFAGCSALQSITLPASLKKIGSEAFCDCSELAQVELKNPRLNILEDAFDGCIFELEQLQTEMASPAEYFELKVDRKNTAKILSYTGDEDVVVIPGMIAGHPITSLEKGCFEGNAYVREIYLDDDISAINGNVFANCPNLEKIHLPNALTKITSAAFSGCIGLREVNIPDSLAEVPRGLFKDCQLNAIHIGKGVKKLGADAFCKGIMDPSTGLLHRDIPLEQLTVDADNESYCAIGTALLSKDGKSLIAEFGSPTHAEIPLGVEEVCDGVYEKMGSLCEVTFPSTLKRIGNKVFAGTALREVDLPDSLEFIGEQAFGYCRSLTKAEFYDGLKMIAPQAFAGCPIRKVFIPATVERLGDGAFQVLSGTPMPCDQELRIDSGNPFLSCDDVALYEKTDNGLTLVKGIHKDLRILVPGAEIAIDYTVRPGTTAIAANAFALCVNLRGITLPEELRSIGDKAFWNCRGMTEIKIPENCNTISPSAFFGIQINILK